MSHGNHSIVTHLVLNRQRNHSKVAFLPLNFKSVGTLVPSCSDGIQGSWEHVLYSTDKGWWVAIPAALAKQVIQLLPLFQCRVCNTREKAPHNVWKFQTLNCLLVSVCHRVTEKNHIEEKNPLQNTPRRAQSWKELAPFLWISRATVSVSSLIRYWISLLRSPY